jgi:hypothetical protein
MTSLLVALVVGVPLSLAFSNFCGFHRGWRKGRRYEAAKHRHPANQTEER